MIKKIYLASRSPRRRELLNQIGVAFDLLLLRENQARAADIDETPRAGETADDYVRRVCTEKAGVAWRRMTQRNFPLMPVLTADTTVCLGDEILGKPTDPDDAARMLSRLSGKDHRVLTAVTIVFEERLATVISESLVRLGELSDDTIRRYVDTGEPMGKAGAYAIQGQAAAFVPLIHGSYSGVMGLPLFETAQLLEKFQ
ncbi:MAG: septum formation inhibitor Maf [Betaproteobacteria bacterium]|nr:septum formation inhibitor Maf [Betaproteobacteria bacterium]